MGDYAIRMQFDVEATPETVRAALTTGDGVRSWWSSKVEGDPADGHFSPHFPDVPQGFDLTVDRDSGDEVVWRVGEFPPWWQGTVIRWRVSDHPDGDGSLLEFRHDGFDQESEIVPIVTPAWVQICLRLQGYAETGRAQPFFDL